jgi:hypothetical protein
MTLPQVNGWIIDYRAAASIFDSGNNLRISHCIDACKNRTLHYCHCEHDDFKRASALSCFVEDAGRRCTPDDDVLLQAASISGYTTTQKMLKGHATTAIFIAAVAAAKNFGVISSHTNLVFCTVVDVCKHYGIVVLTPDQYFALL